MEEQPRNAVLSGYRALDLTDDQGLYGTRWLADMGAEVIRVEPPGATPPNSPCRLTANLGKRSVTLNIESGEGQAILKRLAAAADFLVESYPPGYPDGLGIGYADLSKINPRLIMASITGFGQDGPRRDRAATDLTAGALGGHLYVNGSPDTPPLAPYGRQAYATAGLYTAVSLMLALQDRHRTGKGQYIDISLQACAAATLDHVLVRYFSEGAVARRRGSLYWNGAFRVFPTRDGYILLSIHHQWDTLVAWLDTEGMAGDLASEAWRDTGYRLERIEHVIEVLERWTLAHSAGELVEQGQLMRFPWARVNSPADLPDSPQLKARDYFTEVELPGTGRKCPFPGPPARLSVSPFQPGSRSPLPGEDNTAIYSGEMRIPAAELASLKAGGVI